MLFPSPKAISLKEHVDMIKIIRNLQFEQFVEQIYCLLPRFQRLQTKQKRQQMRKFIKVMIQLGSKTKANVICVGESTIIADCCKRLRQ